MKHQFETPILRIADKNIFPQSARGFTSENCLEEHPAAPTGLVSRLQSAAVGARAKKILSLEQNYSVSERQFSEVNPALPFGFWKNLFAGCRDINITQFRDYN
ncbi:MAG: hypothetical protein AAB514_00945 [Patescibacteria group bacterium]